MKRPEITAQGLVQDDPHEVCSDWETDEASLSLLSFCKISLSSFRRSLTFLVKLGLKWFLTCIFNGTDPEIPKQKGNKTETCVYTYSTCFIDSLLYVRYGVRCREGTDEQANCGLPKVLTGPLKCSSAFQTSSGSHAKWSRVSWALRSMITWHDNLSGSSINSFLLQVKTSWKWGVSETSGHIVISFSLLQ